MGWIKNEGLVQAGVVLGVLVLVGVGDWRILRERIWAICLGSVVILPWLVVYFAAGLGDRWMDFSRVLGWFGAWERHDFTAREAGEELFWGDQRFGGVWWVLGLILLWRLCGWGVRALKGSFPNRETHEINENSGSCSGDGEDDLKTGFSGVAAQAGRLCSLMTQAGRLCSLIFLLAVGIWFLALTVIFQASLEPVWHAYVMWRL